MPHYVAIWPWCKNPKNGLLQVSNNTNNNISIAKILYQKNCHGPKCEHIDWVGPASTTISLQTQFLQFV
jgi:hypothetical protein